MKAKWRIPLVDLARTLSPLAEEYDAAFRRVRESGIYVLGPEVAAFEEECAAYLGVEHAVGVSSGSDALVAALLALEIGRGDEVIVPTFTFIASAEAVVRVGAKPVLVDCMPEGFHADPQAIHAAIGPRTRAIMVVHLFGHAFDMAPITSLARAAKIAVVEDAAQAFGVRTPLGAAGTIGDVGCHSFFPTKTLGALGDGGLVVTRDAAIAARIRSIRQHGMATRDEFTRAGGNHRLDALQAALLRLRLARLPTELAERARGAERYRRLLGHLGERIVLPEPTVGAIDNPFVVRIPEKRDEVERTLATAGIESAVYYRRPLHRQPVLANFVGEGHSFPHAERAAAEAIALPLFPRIRDEEIDEIAAVVGAALITPRVRS